MSNFKRNLSRQCMLRVESLEERRMAAADLTLTATMRQSPYGQGMEVYVDGSDYKDVVRVTAYNPASGGLIKLQLQQYSGTTLLSSKAVSFVNSLYTPPFVVNIDARDGDDVVTNYTTASMMANGGSGSDFLSGGFGFDYLIGDKGLNTLSGNQGDDVLTGGPSRDIIYGGHGNDIIQGLDGDDDLYGDTSSGSSLIAGWDKIYGGTGNDRIWGEAGDDTIEGNDGFDTIFGGLGNDWMYGGLGDDRIYGEDGSDRLYGNDGADYLSGGAHDDYLDGGFWAYSTFNVPDQLWGGTGADTFVRHNSTFGQNDIDYFGDFNSKDGDKWQDIRHW